MNNGYNAKNKSCNDNGKIMDGNNCLSTSNRRILHPIIINVEVVQTIAVTIYIRSTEGINDLIRAC